MTKPSILVISFSHLGSDPRVNRQLRLLSKSYRVTAAGYGDPQLEGVEFIQIRSTPKKFYDRLTAALRLKAGLYEQYYWNIGYIRSALASLSNRTFDVIVANDADTWPLVCSIRQGARLFFDAHEYAPREFEDRLYWRIFYQDYRTWLCRRYLPTADSMMTVCDGIADEYVRVFGIRRPLVVTNTPSAQFGSPLPTPTDQVRLIHHGLAGRSRRIEVMIDLMSHLDKRFTLDLMLVGSESGYLQSLRDRAAGNPQIRFREPVATASIISETRHYDLGLFLLPPTNFNYRFALPNKFFEFIQARLGIAIGPSPEMARLVREYDCGVVAADFTPQALAAALGTVTPVQIDRWKQNAHRAAADLCWDRKSEILQNEVKRLVALSPCAE